MKHKGMRKRMKGFLSILLVLLIAFQGTGPIFVQAQEIIENQPRDVDFSSPEPLTEEEAGISEEENGELQEETQEQVAQEETI